MAKHEIEVYMHLCYFIC